MAYSTENNAEYEDIIVLPRPVSTERKQMSVHDRAAQFAPFAALSGYDEQIQETARLTDARPELDEEACKRIDDCLQILLERAEERPSIIITYFVRDTKKSGGSYITVSGNFKLLDISDSTVVLTDQKKVPIEDIVAIALAEK